MRSFKDFLCEQSTPSYNSVKKQTSARSGFFDEDLAMHIKNYNNTKLYFLREFNAEGKTWRWQKAWDRVWMVEKDGVTFLLAKEVLPDDPAKPWVLYAFSPKLSESALTGMIHKLDSRIPKV